MPLAHATGGPGSEYRGSGLSGGSPDRDSGWLHPNWDWGSGGIPSWIQPLDNMTYSFNDAGLYVVTTRLSLHIAVNSAYDTFGVTPTGTDDGTPGSGARLTNGAMLRATHQLQYGDQKQATQTHDIWIPPGVGYSRDIEGTLTLMVAVDDPSTALIVSTHSSVIMLPSPSADSYFTLADYATHTTDCYLDVQKFGPPLAGKINPASSGLSGAIRLGH